jgi:UDP-3-O-[3-hydroxymyristoyl] glucosamine N-acyltransferase
VKLKELASLLDGEVIGSPQTAELEITGASGVEEAGEGDITFISSKKYLRSLATCRASCVIVKDPISNLGTAQLRVSNPHLAFARVLEYFYSKPVKPIGISKGAIVSAGAKAGRNVSVFPFSYISDGVSIGDNTIIYPHVFIGENAVLGEGCVIYPHVTLREDVKLGDRVIVHSGSVIGSDGFGYIPDKGRHHKIPQVGGVIIEDDVEIGSNVSIDRATTGNTIIGKGTKIDNLCQIAHNVKIGCNSIIVSQVGIAGSTEIGDSVTLAGQVGIVDHVKIESGTIVGAQSGVITSLTKGAYAGSPALPHKDWLKAQAVFAKLPELHKKMKAIEEKIKELERRNPE